ncbi:MAG: L,D-transpeptidase [Bacteroidota bacterium]|nr:L,D-transpeptidase [Bacteroidota bacterium]
MKKCVSLCLLLTLLIATTSFYGKHSFTFPTYSIVIVKHTYELSVYDSKGWLVTYPVVFGNKDLRDKMMEGDRETPEGNFKIVSKRVHEKWCRMLTLDYPNEESITKFIQRKQQGTIPANAKIGGGVAIHGTWPHEDYAIDKYDNWTQGCISMKNEDVIELFKIIPVGTEVSIRR